MEPIRSVAVAVGLLVLAGAPAVAFHDEVPVLASGGGPALGWVSLTFTSDGDFAVTEVIARDVGNVAVATYVLRGSGDPRYGLLFLSLDAPTSATITEVGPDEAAFNERIVAPGVHDGNAGLSMTLNDPGGSAQPLIGTFKVVLFAAGEAQDWSWKFRGGPGTTLDAIEQGGDSFLYTARDFGGLAHIERFDAARGVRAQAANTLTLDVEDRFFGGAYAWNGKEGCAALCLGAPSTDILAVQAPGSLAPARCLCSFSSSPPGPYTFDLTGADASSSERPADFRLREDVVVVVGSDARLAP